MAESLNCQRVFFPPGEQRNFILSAKKDLRATWEDLGLIAGTGARNLIGWKNEKNSMTLAAVRRICKKKNCEMPEGIVLKSAYWYVEKGAKAGGKALVEKYGTVGGDEEYRKKKWREWWEREGKFKPSLITEPLPFKKPEFSEELAEFVGILLGDGGISEHQITITLNSVTDKEYLGFVRKLVERLFEIPMGFYSHKKSLARRIVISRTALISYLIDTIGLEKGNKVRQQVDIPQWVKENRQYSIACVRGLIDTDGCAIIHQYFSKGKKYRYVKVGFTSRSHPLLKSVGRTLSELGIGYRIMKDGFSIRIESQDSVKKYFEIVGTSNKKHEIRYKIA